MGGKTRHFHTADPINTERMMEEKQKLFFATVIVKRFKQESSREAKWG